MGSYYGQIIQFLGADKGILEFRHLGQTEMDSVQTDLFGLEWNSSLGSPDSSQVKFQSSASSDAYYNIYKYFHSIPVYQENFTAGTTDWSTQSGSWYFGSGNYIGDSGSQEAVSFHSSQFQGSYSVRASFRLGTASAVKIIIYRQDANNYASVYFNDNSNTVTVWDNLSGTAINRGSAGYSLSTGAWYDVKIIPDESGSLAVYINGSKILGSQPVTERQNSQIGFGVKGGQASFDDVRVAFSSADRFSGSILQNEKLQPRDGNAQKIMLIQEVTQLPACVVNSNIVNGNGRAAWLAYSDPAASQDVSSMLRTLVVWLAGDENEVIKSEIRNPVIASIYKVYDKDMYQPVEVVLTMGRMYD